MVISEADTWRRRYERERAARMAAEVLAADTLSRFQFQLQAVQAGLDQQLPQRRADFLSVISHELRTPLTILHGGLHILERRGTEDAKISEILGTVARASDRLLRIVQNIEVSARLRDPEHVWGLNTLDVRALVEEVLEGLAPCGQVAVRSTGDVTALASQPLLGSAVANLLHNALTYGEAPVEVTITGTDTVVVLEVLDHGGGLPEDRADLFLDFAQGDIGDCRESKGLGLGLSIVVGAAVRGGWLLDHERRDDVTSFRLRLPNAHASSLADRGARQRSAREVRGPIMMWSPEMRVAEDQPVVVERQQGQAAS